MLHAALSFSMNDTHLEFTSTSLQARWKPPMPAKASTNENLIDELAPDNEPAANFLEKYKKVEELEKAVAEGKAELKDEASDAVDVGLQQVLGIMDKSGLRELSPGGKRILKSINQHLGGGKTPSTNTSSGPRKPHVKKEKKAEVWFSFFAEKKRGDTFTNTDLVKHCETNDVETTGSPAQFFGKLWDLDQIADSKNTVEGTRKIIWKLKKVIKND